MTEEKMSFEAFLASGLLEKEERKKKGILTLSIKDLYKDLDRRLFLLGSRSPFPKGYMKVSKEEMRRSDSKLLERMEAHYKDLQQKIMKIQREHWNTNLVWYVDTSRFEWRIRNFFGMMTSGGGRGRGGW